MVCFPKSYGDDGEHPLGYSGHDDTDHEEDSIHPVVTNLEQEYIDSIMKRIASTQ